MARFLAHWLVLLAAWTLVIKFIFPIIYDAAYGLPLGAHIYWDFWWVIHLWLAWALFYRPSYVYPLALIVTVVEIIIIVTKFVFFLKAPDWTIFETNWFINKVFVLLCFVTMLGWLAWRRPDLTDQSTGHEAEIAER